jgi:hypothetical protein
VIDGSCHIGKKLWVAVSSARDQGSDGNFFCDFGQRSQKRPALKVLAVGVSKEREKVIPRIQNIDAERFCFDGGTFQVMVFSVLGIQ